MIRVGLFSREAKLSAILSSTLGRAFAISPVACAASAQALAREARCDVWIVDVDPAHDPSGEWRNLLEDAAFTTSAPVVVMATDESRPDVLACTALNGLECIRKPPMVRELKMRLQKAYDSQVLNQELESARRHLQEASGLDQLTGSSAPMQDVYSLTRRLARLEASVLITGESGTGKELVARALHNIGSRASRPFVAVSCGAIPETLIEAELFGHEKGAFTGTVGSRQGYLEQAADGTLFFDEIGELSLNTQVKLLRVLQQREFCRVGSGHSIPLRARVVFATNRDLSAMVAEGTFRQDLLYRINVVNIHVPALRHHAEDIPLLAHHFLLQYSTSYGKPVEAIDPGALALLRNHAWPGNVRELENVIQRALILAEDDRLRVCDLPEAIQEQQVVGEESNLPEGSFERLLHDYKLKLVRDAIAQSNGNKTLAAQSLGISRAYLHRLIRPASTENSNVQEISAAYRLASA
jgi:DNA-binding NtrC family response regulator